MLQAFEDGPTKYGPLAHQNEHLIPVERRRQIVLRYRLVEEHHLHVLPERIPIGELPRPALVVVQHSNLEHPASLSAVGGRVHWAVYRRIVGLISTLDLTKAIGEKLSLHGILAQKEGLFISAPRLARTS